MVDLKAAHERKQALAAFSAGHYGKSLQLATKLLRTNKNDHDLQRVVGQSAMRMGKYEDARKALERVIALQPRDVVAKIELGYAYLWDGKVAEAQAQFEKCLAAMPGFPAAIAGQADAFDRENDYDAVERLLKPFVEASNENSTMAITYARMLIHRERYDEAATLARKHLDNKALDSVSRHFLCEMAAKAYEKLGQYGDAFAMFSDSNAVKAQPFSPAEFIQKYDEIISVFSSKNLERLPHSKARSDVPIFIASMPRSGSTLVEQIIHAHPKAFGAGEITDFQEIITDLPSTLSSMWPYPGCLGDFRQEHADTLARQYLSALGQYDRKAARVVNKHLENYRHLGMVQLLLPGARVVHVKRDPIDNCFSCYMAQISTNTYHWSTDLRNVAIAYKQYERIMAHWREVLKIPILDVQYEDLVDDTETWIRKIIDFCGLPWDDRCLRYWEAKRTVMTLSYDQVNKPIYKSAVKRWQKYDEFLGPLREELGLV